MYLATLEREGLSIAHRARVKSALSTFTHASHEAMQIFGGWCYTTDFDVERIWRNARLLEIGAGTTEIRQLIIARELLGKRGH